MVPLQRVKKAPLVFTAAHRDGGWNALTSLSRMRPLPPDMDLPCDPHRRQRPLFAFHSDREPARFPCA